MKIIQAKIEKKETKKDSRAKIIHVQNHFNEKRWNIYYTWMRLNTNCNRFFFFHHLHSLLLLFLCSTHTSHTNFIKFICNAKWAVQLIGVNEWSVKEKNSVSSMIDHILLHLDSIDIKQYNMNVWKLQYRFSRRDGGREVGFEQE